MTSGFDRFRNMTKPRVGIVAMEPAAGTLASPVAKCTATHAAIGGVRMIGIVTAEQLTTIMLLFILTLNNVGRLPQK